jgi:protein-L-isoaspartate(D-aspartate) O-methyltransferase
MFVSRRITFALSALLWFGFTLLASPSEQDFAVARQHMVEDQIKGRGVTDSRVTEVMSSVPRHEFVPENYRARAYQDHPLPIGYGQTISQPYIVAFMTEQLHPQPTDRVLEVGTGSGYQAAVLSKLVAEVYTIEILKPLAQRAEVDLRRLNYSNVKVKAGDGYKGWPEHAPFDAIIVTAAPDHVPQPLIDQLKEGGRMIIPVGGREMQQLYLLEKHAGKLTRRAVLPVNFVPLTREQ